MKVKTMAEVAAMLKRSRENKKLGLREAARMAGISVANLSKLESGEADNPTMVTIVRLSPVLGLRPRDWFSELGKSMAEVEELALRKLSEAFDRFVGACMDESGKSKAPSVQELAKARGYLPPYCQNAYKKR